MIDSVSGFQFHKENRSRFCMVRKAESLHSAGLPSLTVKRASVSLITTPLFSACSGRNGYSDSDDVLSQKSYVKATCPVKAGLVRVKRQGTLQQGLPRHTSLSTR